MKSFAKAILVVAAFAVASPVFAASRLCEGQTVYGNNGADLVGSVVAIFGEKAQVRWALRNGSDYSGDYYWDISLLSAQVPCAGEVCAHRNVYANNGHDLVGTVTRVFENGKAEVGWALLDGKDYNDRFFYWDASSLAVEVECSGAICKGDEVYGNNGHNLVGVVEHVFANGKAQVKWALMDGNAYDDRPFYWDASTLTRQTRCSGERHCQ